MGKFFLTCFSLNLVGYFVLNFMYPSAVEMGMVGLGYTYLFFGTMLIVAVDAMFIKRVVAYIRNRNS